MTATLGRLSHEAWSGILASQRSISFLYPGVRILVVDDSPHIEYGIALTLTLHADQFKHSETVSSRGSEGVCPTAFHQRDQLLTLCISWRRNYLSALLQC